MRPLLLGGIAEKDGCICLQTGANISSTWKQAAQMLRETKLEGASA